MAFSAHKDPEAIKEHFSDETTVRKQAKELAQWIQQAKHFTAFTGAGVSTAAGISDFRGPQGVWTLRAQGKQTARGTDTIKAFPTPSHMALVALAKQGLLKFLISQNCDGLHRRSGFPPNQLAELHGNSTLEYCPKCHREFVRDFRVRRAGNQVHDHTTDRQCSDCKVNLKDSIINFSENLPEKAMNNGFLNAAKSDLCLVLGSSLTVTPAADMPRNTATKKDGQLVICNLQKTPLDDHAAMRVFAKTDDFMKLVMQELGLEIPYWQLERCLILSQTTNGESLALSSETQDRIPLSFIKQASLFQKGQALERITKEPLNFRTPLASITGMDTTLHMDFMGHFHEPALEIPLFKVARVLPARINAFYNPGNGEWKIEMS